MGKTPEKPHASSRTALAPGLRYRRKAPATSESSNDAPERTHVNNVAPAKLLKQQSSPSPPRRARGRTNQDADAVPRAPDSSSSRMVDTSDNQLEHRCAEPAALAVSDPAGPDRRPETAKDAHAPGRKKKKHKPVADAPEHPDAPSTSAKQPKTKGPRHPKASPDPERTASVPEPAAEPADRALKPKRAKRSKRTALDESVSAPPARSEPVATDASPALVPDASPLVQAAAASSSSRKRTERASLLKTLLWKVKASPPPSSLPLPSDVSAPSALRPRSHSDSDDSDSNGDEELAFAAAERQTRKRLALETATAKTLQRCSVASSSQETQSGSDDEAFSPFSLVPSADASVAAPSCFPTPLALDDIASALAPRAQVHEVTLDNFAFSPSEVAIVKGDVVVWRVRDDTPALVEHALDATLYDADGTTAVRKTATPTLRPGSAFGWRFDAPGRLDVACSVYHAQCTVVISASVAAKRRATLAPVAPKPQPKTAAAKRRAKRTAAAAAPAPVTRDAVDSALDEEPADVVAVFHPAPDLAHVPEADAGVCRAVLAHLEDVQAAAAAAFIVVGDVACPLASDGATTEPLASDSADADDVSDFAQRILAMLARSEAHLAQHRISFDVADSGFDARAAYDFFKQRYALAAADPSVVYARCPERVRPAWDASL